jgi:hypothetical protein
MTNDNEQAAHDEWQTALYEASRSYSATLQELSKTNPWPDIPVLAQALNTLATELWDRCFSVSDITTAFSDSALNLPRYAAGDEVRP